MATETVTKSDIQTFWKSLYESLYDEVDRELTHERLIQGIRDLEEMFRFRRHLAVVEMPLRELNGQRVLEVGCGAGGHSALFAYHGATMTSIDLTLARCRSTAAKFALLGEAAQGCLAMQSDAEALPFEDGTFDIVYSNGVLHHTTDTEKAIAEVYRVLKPGGRAVIMLYCMSSWHYWVNMVLFVGFLKGQLWRQRNWLGKATEWGGRNSQTVENPITRCYTKRGIRKLFSAFEGLTLRKGDFFFYLIPKLGRLYRRWQIRRYGLHPGGVLVYGEPWPVQSPLELRLGQIMGFSWWIAATKPKT